MTPADATLCSLIDGALCESCARAVVDLIGKFGNEVDQVPDGGEHRVARRSDRPAQHLGPGQACFVDRRCECGVQAVADCLDLIRSAHRANVGPSAGSRSVMS